MKYCSACKKISFADSERCDCGRKFAKKYDLNAPVEIIRTDSAKKQLAEERLSAANVPYSAADISGYSPSVGKITEGTSFMIPLGFLKIAIDSLSEAGLMERPEWYDKLDLPDEPEWEEMPRGKQTAIRIFSVIGFLFLIWLCVFAVDYIAVKLFGIAI